MNMTGYRCVSDNFDFYSLFLKENMSIVHKNLFKIVAKYFLMEAYKLFGDSFFAQFPRIAVLNRSVKFCDNFDPRLNLLCG